MKDLSQLTAFAKEHGFIFPSSEIYEGLGGVYDYGPLGVELKKRIADLWWRAIVQVHENIYGLDAAIIMHPKTWYASGHVEAFHDPLVDNKINKKRYRVDTLIEEYTDKLQHRALKSAQKKAQKDSRPIEVLIQEEKDYIQAQTLREKLTKALAQKDWQSLTDLLKTYEIPDPESGAAQWTDVRQFNLMFSTKLGAVADEAQEIYLRPETAQGIFVNFLNVQKTMRAKIPFGIAQIGKAFRNEIIARQFIFRMREFEQMEMQFFIRPNTDTEWFEYWQEKRLKWHHNLGLKNLQIKPHTQLAHYAKAAVDIEFAFPFGYKELEGIHARGNYDLQQHTTYSGKKLEYYDQELKTSYIPHVIETSVGLDRLVLAHLANNLVEDHAPTADGKIEPRIVLKLHPLLAPISAVVLPLVRKEEFILPARRLYQELRFEFSVAYEEKDTIGRRYRRYDAKGTPYAITIDAQTLEDETVTLRDRDTLAQIRLPLQGVASYLSQKLHIPTWLSQL